MIVIIHCNKNNKIADYLNFKKKKQGKEEKGEQRQALGSSSRRNSSTKFCTKKLIKRIGGTHQTPCFSILKRYLSLDLMPSQCDD